MKSFSRNIKAISPIFATLILIAIAVIAGIVVYMFTSGTLASMTGSGTAGQEKAAVQGVDITNNQVLAQNTGGTEVTINGYIIKDTTGTIVGQAATTGTLTTDGALVPITVTLPTAGTTAQSYTVTLTSARGGSFVSSAFTVPAA